MKLFLVLIQILTPLHIYAQQASGREISGTYAPGLYHSRNFVKNPGAEKNVLYTTNSASIVTRTTSSPVMGAASYLIDGTSSAQTVKFDTETLDNNLKGQNCEARFTFTGDASLYKAYVEQGSTKVTSDLTLTNESNARDASINFPCGDLSSNSHLVIETTSASAAAIKVDDVYLGKVTNLSSVSQSYFIGSAYFATTGSCTWTRTNTSMGAFSTTAACPGPTVEYNPGPGVIQTTDADLPRITVNNLPAGEYTILATFMSSPSAASVNNYAINDGTTTSGDGGGPQSIIRQGATIVAHFSYSSSGNRTFEIYGAASSGNAVITNQSGTEKLRFEILYNPSSSSRVLNPNSYPWYVDATMDGANPSLGTSAQTSYVEITDAGLTLKPQSGSAAVGVMCSSTNAATAPTTSNNTCSAGSESLGINFSIPDAGSYEVCFYGTHYVAANTGASIDAAFQLIETPTNAQTLTLEGGTRQASVHQGMTIGGGTGSSVGNSISNCSIFNWSSSGIKGVRLMYEQSVVATVTGNTILADAGANNGQRNIRWTVKPLTRQMPMPILVGGLTSSSTGQDRFSYIELNYCGTNGTCPTPIKATPDVTSVTRASTGTFTINFAGGSYLSKPICSYSPNSQNVYGQFTSYSSNALTMIIRSIAASTGTDADGQVICVGPR